MTYWADNIKFIKDCLDSKYKKIEDSLLDVSIESLNSFQASTAEIQFSTLSLVRSAW